VRVRLPIDKPHEALLISEQALATDQDKKYVYVATTEEIEGKDKYYAKYREVQVGRLHDGLREITKGLKSNEFVVVRGLQRIKRDAEITREIVDMPVVRAKAKGKLQPKSSTNK
jgi:multidrug efflux pump subunit AcrA (membrane-fusion protein)